MDPAPWLFAHIMFYNSFTHTKLVLASVRYISCWSFYDAHLCKFFNEADV